MSKESPQSTDTEQSNVVPRREALRRISIGALTTVSAPWMIAQTHALGRRPGWCGFPEANSTYDTDGLPCADAPTVDPRLSTPLCAGNESLGLKVLSHLGSVLGGLLGFIPGPGKVIGAIVSAAWGFIPFGNGPQPCQADDIWNLIKDRVKALVDAEVHAAIETFYRDLIATYLSDLKTEFDSYNSYVQLGVKYGNYNYVRDQVPTVLAACAAALNFCKGTSEVKAWAVLPNYVQVVNLYLALLHDLLANQTLYQLEPAQVDNYTQLWKMALSDGTYKPETYPALIVDDPNPAHYCLFYVMSKYDAESSPGVYKPGTMLQAIEEDYQKNWRGNFSVANANRSVETTEFYDRMHSGVTARGAWEGKRVQNARIMNGHLMVGDFRSIWQGFPADPATDRARPVLLNRVLTLGPWGWPDVRDIGLEPTWHRVNKVVRGSDITVNYLETPPSIKPDVPAWPQSEDRSSTGRSIRLIHFDPDIQYKAQYYRPASINRWQLPTWHMVFGNDRPTNPPPGFNMSLSEDNPVIKVNMHTCERWLALSYYRTRNKEPVQSDYYICNSRYVIGLEFECLNPTQTPSQRVGSTTQSTFDKEDIDRTDNEVAGGHSIDLEVATVDGKHMLVDIFRPSENSHLFVHFDYGINNGYKSMGSVMFRFARIDPQVKADAAALATLYVASPEALSIEALMEIGRASQMRHGRDMTETELAKLVDELLDVIEDGDLKRVRDAHWQALGVAQQL